MMDKNRRTIDRMLQIQKSKKWFLIKPISERFVGAWRRIVWGKIMKTKDQMMPIELSITVKYQDMTDSPLTAGPFKINPKHINNE